MIKRLTKVRLPNEYQRVEYIKQQTSTTPYINTGIVPNDNTRVVLDVFSSNYASFYLFGVRGSDNVGIYTIGGANADKTINFTVEGVVVVSEWKRTSSGQRIICDIETFGNYQFSADFYNKTTGERSKQISSYSKTVSTDMSMCIFSNNVNRLSGGDNRIYSCKIWKDGNFVMQLVPCYRKIDKIAGMYDVISRKFLINSGTGTFLVGEDVNDPIEVWHTVKSIKRKVGGTMKEVRTIKRVVDRTLRTITI